MEKKLKMAKSLAEAGEFQGCLEFMLSSVEDKLLSLKIKRGGVFPKVAVLGFPRVGKSVISKALSDRLELVPVPLDEYRRVYWELSGEVRSYLRVSFLSGLAMKRGGGVVVEGDDILTKNRSSRNGFSPLTGVYAQFLSDILGFKVFVVGNASCTVGEKAKGMESWAEKNACWASEEGSRKVKEVAKESILVSSQLERLFNGTKVKYLDIDPNNFNVSVESAIDLISEDVQKC